MHKVSLYEYREDEYETGKADLPKSLEVIGGQLRAPIKMWPNGLKCRKFVSF